MLMRFCARGAKQLPTSLVQHNLRDLHLARGALSNVVSDSICFGMQPRALLYLCVP